MLFKNIYFLKNIKLIFYSICFDDFDVVILKIKKIQKTLNWLTYQNII